VTRSFLCLAGVSGLAALCGVCLVFLSNIRDFDLADFETVDLTFVHGSADIGGTLHLPDAKTPPLLVLVHGDGPQDRHAGGSLLPLIRVLLENGIAVFSWDKPGIGASSGNWLHYSMTDRSSLVANAIARLTSDPDHRFASIGVLGFSQAGWVLPDLALRDTEADHFMLVGGAINWLRQGEYFTRTRLKRQGKSQDKINQAFFEKARRNADLQREDLSYETYVANHPAGGTPMSKDRFHFVRENMKSDAANTLRRVQKPFMSVHGSEDLNVDPDFNVKEYRRLLARGHKKNEAIVIPDAGHGLLKAAHYNYQLPDEMPWWTQARFVLSGRDAYAPGALDLIITRTKRFSTSKD